MNCSVDAVCVLQIGAVELKQPEFFSRYLNTNPYTFLQNK